MGLFDTYKINQAIAILLTSQDAARTETIQAVTTLKRSGNLAIPKLIEALGKVQNPYTVVALLATLVQNAMLPRRTSSRQRFLCHLHAQQVPPGDRPGAGDSHPGRFLHASFDDRRSQSSGRGTSAGRAAAKGRAENLEAEKAEKAEGRGRGAACRGITIPRTAASTSAAATRADPLIACTAPDKVRIVRRSHHA